MSKRANEFTRDPTKSFQLTQRDIEILKAVSRFRYLRTSQMQKLLFPDNRSSHAIKRRLRGLYDHSFLNRFVPYVKMNEGKPEIAYFLTRKGCEVLEDFGMEVRYSPSAERVKHAYFNHAMDVSEFRLCTELGLRDHQKVTLARFTPDFELRPDFHQVAGKHRFLLYQELEAPQFRRKYIFYPDVLLVLAVKDRPDVQALYFVEIDRGTESLTRIHEKLVAYELLYRLNLFQEFANAKSFKVLFQCAGLKRRDSILAFLPRQENINSLLQGDMVWCAFKKDVDETSLFSRPIWRGIQGNNRQLIR